MRQALASECACKAECTWGVIELGVVLSRGVRECSKVDSADCPGSDVTVGTSVGEGGV